MPNYQEGKIYKIYNTVNDEIYIGSTTRKLSERMAEHRKPYTIKRHGHLPIYEAFIEFGVENFFIELVEKCPCNDIEELSKKEGEYIRKLKPSLNKFITGRTKHEYYNDNKDRMLQDCKVKYVENRSYILERAKKYRENNRHIVRKKQNI